MQDASQSVNDSKRIKQIQAIKQFLETDRPLMTIIGENSNSTSALLSDIVLQQQKHSQILRLQGNELLQPVQFLNAIAAHWDLQAIDIDLRLESQIDSLTHHLRHLKKSYLIIIDSAQELSLTMLATLTHLADRMDTKQTHFHILLSGTLKLTERVKSLTQLNIPELVIDALSREAAYDEIQTLLEEHHLDLPKQTMNTMMKSLFEHSNGIQQRLTHLATSLIADKKPPPKNKHENNAPDSWLSTFWQQHKIKTFSMLMLLCLGYFYWQWQHDNLKRPAAIPQPAVTAPANTTTTQTNGPRKSSISPPAKTQHTEAGKSVSPNTPSTPISLPSSVQPHSHSLYTIQLAGSLQRASLERFQKQHHLTTQTIIHQGIRQEKPWFTLRYGQFSSLQSAHKALNTINQHIVDTKHAKPWIKPLKNTNTKTS